MKRSLFFFSLAGLILSATLITVGCGEKGPGQAQSNKADRHDADEHGHAKGVISMGDYHAKMLVEQGGLLKLFILGKDETKVATIETQDVQGHIRVEGETESIPIALKSDPQPGDASGKTSQFIGKIPAELQGKPLIATFRLTIAGEAYRPEFQAGGGNHGDHAAMPKGVDRSSGISEEERELYLTPGGIYTAEDIAVNGNTIPSQKFKNIRWAHGKAKPGDKICPVTDNKADPKCTWVVSGQTYEFCCPPCLDKFIETAKNEPESIKPPTAYIKRGQGDK